jgi:hypothetical protein
MKSISHYDIADMIYEEQIEAKYPRYKEELRNGSVHPHKEGVSVPHYKGREDDIELFIRKARRFMIDKKPKDAIFYMGIALHYIQDKWTTLDNSHKKHEDYTTLISKTKILPYGSDLSGYYPILSERAFEQYENIVSCYNQTSLDIEKIFQIIRQWKPIESSAFLDLNMAYRISYKVSEIVLQPTKHKEYEKLVKDLFNEYEEKITARDQEEREKLEIKREEFESIKEEKGLLVFISRHFAKKRLETATKKYDEQYHLKDLYKQFNNDFNEISAPYRDWYYVGEPPEFSIKEKVQVEDMDIVVEQVIA